MEKEINLNGFHIIENYQINPQTNEPIFISGYVEDISDKKIITTLNAPVDVLPLSHNTILVVETQGYFSYLIIKTDQDIKVNIFKHTPSIGTENENPSYILTDFLQGEDLIILEDNRGIPKYYLVDSKTGNRISAGYDKIYAEDDTDIIFVENYLPWLNDSLCGEINKHGHLIDGTMRLRKICTDVYIDEDNMTSSLQKINKNYQKLAHKYKKKKFQKELIDYEYECYLKRREKK